MTATATPARRERRRRIPLSDASTRTRKIVATSAAKPVDLSYSGSFSSTFGYVVNLFQQGTYDEVKILRDDESELTLELEWLNEHDYNAVRVLAGDLFVGHLDRDTAAELGPELRQGAKMAARVIAGPWGGRSNRGGQAELEIKLQA